MLTAAATAIMSATTGATSATTTTGGSSGGANYTFVFILLAFAALYFLFVRPQRRKQRAQQSMQTELAIGDEILTAGGVYGTVTEVGEDEIRVEIAPNVEIRLARRAIAAQLTEHALDDESAGEPETETDGVAADESDEGSEPG